MEWTEMELLHIYTAELAVHQMLVWFLLLAAYYATVDGVVRAVTVDLSYLVLYSGHIRQLF